MDVHVVNQPRSFYSARQRVIVLTFDTVLEAEQWDADPARFVHLLISGLLKGTP